MKESLHKSKDNCPNCNTPEVETSYSIQKFKYGVGDEAVNLEAVVPILTCKNCGFEYTDFRAEESQHNAVCRHLGVMTPQDIFNLRKKYNFSRTDFAKTTAIGEASLARWETGELIQNSANDNYLYLLSFAENLVRLQMRKTRRKKTSSNVKFKALGNQKLIEEKKREASCFSL